VKQHVANSDYSILLRHNTVNANAGFSTKVGESMACGTPVIANITSDLAFYVKNGETGVVCDDESIDSCVNAFRRIISMPANQYVTMRLKAKELARASFNMEAYVDLLADLVEDEL